MRTVKAIQTELDKAIEEYKEAVKKRNESEVERLSDKISDLELERDWVLL